MVVWVHCSTHFFSNTLVSPAGNVRPEPHLAARLARAKATRRQLAAILRLLDEDIADMTGTAIDPEEQLLEGSRGRRGETGPQLPDFDLPEVTEEFRMLVGRCAREDVGVLAREVFKHLVGLQRYKLWAGKVNWFGTDGKSAVPENVRAKVMEMVHRRHKGDQEVAGSSLSH